MRCFKNVLTVSWCLLFASLLGAPTANAADGGRTASPAKVSSGVESASIPNAATMPAASAQENAAERYGDLPLSFEPNQGQLDGQVRFVSRGSGYSFFLTQAGAVLSFSKDPNSDAVLRMQLAGASPSAHIEGLDVLPGKSNYFAGSDANRWRTGVPTYSRVKYENVYPGISLVYYGNQRQLEYDFVVAPGADPSQIRLSVAGAEELSVDSQGNLVLHNAAGEVQLLSPRVYQQIHGQKHEIIGQWTLDANNSAGFRLGAYDRTQPLVIDPVLMYSSFLGGSQKNVLSKIAIDAAGNAYVAGYTTSGDFPAAPTPLATTFGAGAQSRGAFVAKIDPTGSNLLYSTYLSGSSDEEATALAIDKSGNVYVAGNTHSIDFPTRNALQSTCASHTQAGTCSSAFLTKISPTGDALLFSTYLGGSGGESARGLVVDAAGSAYVAGVTSSLDFPVTSGAAQAKCGGACQQNAFIAKFSSAGDKLVFATYLGGSAVDDAADLAVDSTGNAYLAGHTTSADFPLAASYQKSCAADATSASGACVATAFVAKIKSDGSAFVYSTYLGGSLGSKASAVAVDSLGSAYVTGSTQSADFPVFKPFQKSCGLDAATGQCSIDAFVTKFAPTGKTVVYSTYLGGAGRDEPSGIAVDAAGNAHIVGSTESPNFPTAASAQSKLKGTSDAFAARLNPAGTSLTFSTYHGGTATESGNSIALDPKGNIYLAGETSSTDFPTSHPFQSSCAGACTSAFITKMALPPPAVAPPTILKSFAPSTIPLNGTSTLTLAISNPGTNVVALTGVAVSDTLPSGMSVATPDNLATSCGGTATDSGGILSLTAGSIPVGGSCTVTVDVNGTTAGDILNTTDPVTSTNGGTGLAAPGTLTVVAPPTLAKGFAPASVALNTGVSVLTLTITNPGTNTAALTGVAVSDPLPSGMAFASTPNLTNTCGGTATATAGVLSLTGGGIAIGGNCAVTVDVNGTTAGNIKNTTGTVSSTNGGTGLATNATLKVVAPPTMVKAFNPTSVALNTGVSTLSLTITNPGANTAALAGVAVSDTLPAGMVFASAPNLTNTCGGTPAAVAGVLSLTAGSIGIGGNCKVTVDVNATATGNIKNTTGPVSSTNGGTGLTANATLGSSAPPTIAKAFGAATVVLGNSRTLTFTVTNPNTTALTGVAFTDSLPTGLTVSNPNGLVNTCNGTPSAGAAGSLVSLTGGTIPASGSCTLTVNVTGTADGAQDNTTGPVSSTEGGTGLVSNTATLTVQDFTWKISPSSATVIEGQSTGGNSPVATAAPVNGYNQTITVVTPCVVSPPTATITCTPSGTIANGSGSATVTINTTAATPVGAYAVTIEGTDASTVPLHYSKTFTLTVECTLTASAPAQIFADSGTFSLTVTETAGGTNCGWTATSDSPWVTFPSGSTGTNTGVGNQQTVSFKAATNFVNQAPTRTAILSVSEYPGEVVQPSTAVTQDDVLVTVPTFKTPSTCSVTAAPPTLHVNSGATACFTSTAVGTLGVGTSTPGVNWATVGTGCGTGPCSSSIVSSTPIIGVYTAPPNIAGSGAVYSGGQGSTTDGVQSSWVKYNPPPSGTPQVQQLPNAVTILNDAPTCTGAPGLLAAPTASTALTAVVVGLVHTCSDNPVENDITTVSVASTPAAQTTSAPVSYSPTTSSAAVAGSFVYNVAGNFQIGDTASDTSNATGTNTTSAFVSITHLASDLDSLQVTAGGNNTQTLLNPNGPTVTSFVFASSSTDPCVPATNTNGATVSGVIRSDGATDSGNYGITCSLTSSAPWVLTVNTTAATNPGTSAARAARKLPASLLFLSLGLPGLVFLSLGVPRFRSQRRGVRRLLCLFGLLVVIAALVALPACGGGIGVKVNPPGTNTVTYFLTVTGVDVSGTQQTYIVPVTVAPPQ